MFKKINAWLHLWLGIASGIIVFIISITGCILVFEQEINSLLDAKLNVEPQHESKMLPPTLISKAVTKAIPGKVVSSIWYHGLDKTAAVSIDNSDSTVYVNPFTAEIVAYKHHEDFFHEIDELHRNLMLGREIGKPVVGWSTLIFFFLMVSGLIMWFPKKWTKSTRNQSFKIKWKAKFKRVNYDLHNVLGFYSLLLGILMAITGLIMSFSWFSRSMYWVTGGDAAGRQKRPEKKEILKETDPVPAQADSIFYKVRREIAQQEKNSIIINLPKNGESPIYACTDMHIGFWRDLYFDPVTLELLPGSGKRLGDLKFPDQVRKLNYALHVGAIGGIWTKIIYFFASLICASLPVTGFCIWWGKQQKKKIASKTG